MAASDRDLLNEKRAAAEGLQPFFMAGQAGWEHATPLEVRYRTDVNDPGWDIALAMALPCADPAMGVLEKTNQDTA